MASIMLRQGRQHVRLGKTHTPYLFTPNFDSEQWRKSSAYTIPFIQ